MKKLMTSMAVALCAASLFGAQCMGKTLAGERCKRDAAEGSKYCIGHADQAKSAAKEKVVEKAKPAAGTKELDNGQCWAVTQAGTRCKHKKDGEKDYCRQHAADVKAKTPQDQCRAMTYEGTRCTRKPDAGFYYCSQHRK